MLTENGLACVLFNQVIREVPDQSSPLRNFCLKEFVVEIVLADPPTRTSFLRFFNKYKAETYHSLLIAVASRSALRGIHKLLYYLVT